MNWFMNILHDAEMDVAGWPEGMRRGIPMSDPTTQLTDIWAGTTFETRAEREAREMPTTAETPTMATRPPKYVGVRGPVDGMHEPHRAGSYLELTVVERDAVRHWLISRDTAALLRDEINGILNEPKD